MAEARLPKAGLRTTPAGDHAAAALRRRAVVEHLSPQIDNGRFPIKRTTGDRVEVTADAFADGHDVLCVVLRDRHVGGFARSSRAHDPDPPDAAAWRETPMRPVAPGTDRWIASFGVPAIGRHEYAVVAWVDRFQTWRRDLTIKSRAGQEVGVELIEGSLMVREAAGRASLAHMPDAEWLLARADALSDDSPADERVALAMDDDLARLMFAHADRENATASPTLDVWVDRPRARFGAWYEMFPRSFTPDVSRSGTFRDACVHLSYIADLGFDIVYLPPVHPIGTSFRKGRNNTLTAAPGDPGSPWAIGSAVGGHTAVDPGLGTIDDFLAFQAEAHRLGLEVALDLAWQCSPDHPWVQEHPEWFRHRPDGTIKHAENPPKKYQDIYPFDFDNDDWRGLWTALLDVTLFWVERGVRIFRVDNPHTKTFGFWEWLIAEVHARDPEVLFLSEAFTRPRVMEYLAKSGFTQSYTYFTWRNTKAELEAYLTELTQTDVREYLRPNLFANTPDILHEYLQHGGRPAFEARLLLAATLGASYGIYSGFELCENVAVAAGSEEYANSEKYEHRPRDWNRPGHIKELVARVNQIRRAEPALHFNDSLAFTATDNPSIVAYTKTSPEPTTTLLVIVNLDPHTMQHGWVEVPMEALASVGATPDGSGTFAVRDLLDDVRYLWRGAWNYVRFDPGVRQGHIFKLERQP